MIVNYLLRIHAFTTHSIWSPDLKRLPLLLMALLALPFYAAAQTVYISDTLYVPMRSGPGTQFRIVNRALKTGTPLTLLNKEKKEGYYEVKSVNGQEGYVPEQYILFQPTAALQLKNAQSSNEKLNAEVAELKSRLNSASGELKSKASSLNSNTEELEKVKTELNHIKAISSKSLDLDKRNKELVLTNEQLLNELQTLQSTNQQLADSSTQKWYIYGAATLFLGLLFGLVAPHLQPRRKKSGWA